MAKRICFSFAGDLGPARTVPGGHLVYTDEANLWFTTNVRQFEDRAVAPTSDGSVERDLLPARRVKGKTSVVELASGAGLMPGCCLLRRLILWRRENP